jgi:hypothetical protein
VRGARAALLAALALLLLLDGGPVARAQTAPAAPAQPRSGIQVQPRPQAPVDPNKLVYQADLDVIPAGMRHSGRQVQAIADAVPLIVAERRKFPGSYPGVFRKGTGRWQVSYYDRHATPAREIGQVTIDDATGKVTEAYVGYKVAWTMARGYPGAFGRKVNSPWVWIPLTIVFVVAFLDWRRPLRLLHLDLLVLVAFGVSVAFFNDAQISVSVPIVYPLLAYLLARMLWIGLRSRPETDPPRPLALLVPATWLAIGVVFLLGFRIGLNVTNSNVIDVGYSGVIGADKLVHGKPLYGTFPKDDEHGDTYGPVNYAAYVPFVQALGWSGRWDDLPAAHGAAIAFDLLSVGLLLLIGRRIRGPTLGWALAFGWCAYPFTLYVLNCNSNDALVSVLVLLAIWVAGSAPARGVAVALGGLAKFATLALAPLFAFHGAVRRRTVAAFTAAFAACAALAMVPVIAQGESLSTMYDRTLGFQAQRGSPFSIWGLYHLDALQHVWQLAAVVLALGIVLLPRRRDLVGLAACAAAILIALQLGVSHWFYLYLVWFFPLALVALLGRYAEPRPR